MRKLGVLPTLGVAAEFGAAVSKAVPDPAFAPDATYAVTAGSADDDTAVSWTAPTDAVTFTDAINHMTATCTGSLVPGSATVGEPGNGLAPIFAASVVSDTAGATYPLQRDCPTTRTITRSP